MVVLILGLFVVRPLLSPKPREADPGLLPMSLEGSDQDAAISPLAIAGEVPGETLRIEGSVEEASATGLDEDTPEMLPEDPIETLKTIASTQSSEAAELLASWLEQDTRQAS